MSFADIELLTSKQSMKNEAPSKSQNMMTTHGEQESKESKTIHVDSTFSPHDQWEILRQYELHHLQSISPLTSEDMLDIDQWLAKLQRIYEESRYPVSLRIWQTMSYLPLEERVCVTGFSCPLPLDCSSSFFPLR